MHRLAVIALVAFAAPAVAHAERPAAVALGLGAAIESTPVGARATSTPVTIDAGAGLAAPLWWHVGATFGAATLADDRGAGHTFALRTGPRLERCIDGTLCVGVGLEVGWGHARWTSTAGDATVTVDGVDGSAALHAAVALDDRRKVFLAAAAGPTVRYAVRTSDPSKWALMSDRVDAGVSVGVQLVVRN